MKLDFWNNPIIVSAFRVKYRRGGLFTLITIYFLVILTGGMVLFNYRDRLWGPWIDVYLLLMLCLQFIISGLMAATTTSSSVRAEIVNRTLDVQRLAAMSPGQILLGKLLGEPAVAYFLAMMSFPVTAWCCLAGVAGMGVAELPLVYLSLATSIILMSTFGLLQPFEPPPGKAGIPGGGMGWGFFFMIGMVQLVVTSNLFVRTPWSMAIIGALTPVPALYGLAQGDIWRFKLSIFGLDIPYLLTTPITQLLIGYLIFQSAVRQLHNPINTRFSRLATYITLGLVDLLAGAVLHDPVLLTLDQRVSRFCLIHLIAVLVLLLGATPSRACLQSWIWRHGRRRVGLRDLWLGARSDTILMNCTHALIGIAGLGSFVLLPAWLHGGTAIVRPALPAALVQAGATALYIIAAGTIYQAFMALAGNNGRGMFFMVAGLLVIPPHLAGYYYGLDWLRALSPSAQFACWLGGRDELDVWPMLIMYASLFAIFRLCLHRYFSILTHGVTLKLKRMGILQAAPQNP